VSSAPADGERAALRGYTRQYDHIAALVYDAILDNDLVALRLTDPDAGQVDDLVLVRRSRVDGYQFKSSEFAGYVTFNTLAKERTTRSGNPAPSLLRALGDGWRTLRASYENPGVHLVTDEFASVHDRLGDVTDRPSPDHFSAFVISVLEPARLGQLSLAEVEPGWRPAVKRFQESCGVSEDDLDSFVRSLYLDLGIRPDIPPGPSTRRSDVVALSHALARKVAESVSVVELDRVGVLDLMGWGDRPRLRSRHEFPVDLDSYSPLDAAVGELHQQLADRNRGYIAVIGPPGSGKSTLLSHALVGQADRIVRYYAYVPNAAPARTRLDALAFLHDVVVMLSDAGLREGERHLPSSDIQALRQQLADLLDAAGVDFVKTGRRTVIVVDGLDHVSRDGRDDGLLVELPRPEELPDGVLFIVGSRTLDPLNAFAKQHVTDLHATVDLQHHRLSPAALLDVCRRVAVTAEMSSSVHERIAELSAGHPLALSYLLNRLREAGNGDPNIALSTAPAYAGDIAAEYRAVWESVEADDGVVDILAVCSRLRIGFTTEWLEAWAAPAAVRTFRRRFLYLFRHHHDGWRFFHDSFRQYAADHTALGDDGFPNESADARSHQRAAELCATSADRRIADEELHHRARAGQDADALRLGQQASFRSQFHRLRATDLIRADIDITLAIAGSRADIRALARSTFALVELTEREQALDDIDFPGVLYDTGLVDEAIAYCGAEVRRVPLAHAYELAARLGRTGDPAGRRIFDLVHHDGLDDPARTRVSGHEDDAAIAWVRAAILFVALPTVIAAMRGVLADSRRGRNDRYDRGEQRRRHARMMHTLIQELGSHSGEERLATVDAELAALIAQSVAERNQLQAGLSESESDGPDDDANRDDDERNERVEIIDTDIATFVELRVELHLALLNLATKAETANEYLDRLETLTSGVPMFHSVLLDSAEVLARYERDRRAEELLHESPYIKALTVRSLSHTGDTDSVDHRFRYLRVRHLLAARGGPTVPEPVPPSQRTPAGDGIVPDAPIHGDVPAIELAERIESGVRVLAAVDAAVTDSTNAGEVWTTVVPLLDIFRHAGGRSSATLGGIAGQKPSFMRLLVRVVLGHGGALSGRLAATLDARFKEQPERWPIGLRLALADELRERGVNAPWYADAVAASEAAAADQDVYSRLDDTASLAHRYARDGDLEAARRLAQALPRLAFGVGYRKDYQFDAWVAWLAMAVSESSGREVINDASWLARLITAADPMTEGAPSDAAVGLPAAIAPVASTAAVRTFEYLVRHGTVRHMDALADLVRALVEIANTAGDFAIDLAAELTAELIAPASDVARPRLAEALVHAGASAGAIQALAARTDRYALPTARAEWRRGLGLASPTETADDVERDRVTSSSRQFESDYGSLLLVDGERIAKEDVNSRAQSIDDIIALRRAEASDSTYYWDELLRRPLDTNEIERLVEVFDGADPRSGKALTALAEAAEGRDDSLALELAMRALPRTSSNSWSRNYGGERRRAAGVIARLGGKDGRITVCRDLAEQFSSSRWLAGMVLHDLAEVLTSIDPGTSMLNTWTEVRAYLEGIAESLVLPADDVLADAGCRWWLDLSAPDHGPESAEHDVTDALAELTVRHLSHPAWVIRDAATRVVIRALLRGNEAVVAALARFMSLDATDEILELAGACLAAARSHAGYEVPTTLEEPLQRLASHPNQILRDLAGSGAGPTRPLSPVYKLVLPGQNANAIGRQPTVLWPYTTQYEMLAEYLGLEPDTVLSVAERYALEAAARLPTADEVRATLDSRGVRHVFRIPDTDASRAAFGRVLADLVDARLLDDLDPAMARRLRTFDPALLERAPTSRPPVIPNPPAAGHDLTSARWADTIESRLDQHVAAVYADNRILVGAKSHLTVLNWGHLEEEFVCTVTVECPEAPVGAFMNRPAMYLRELIDSVSPRRPTAGTPLVMQNIAHTFDRIHSDWLAFRPEIAAALGWATDRSSPGTWTTRTGAVAVESLWWTDGWWGRSGPVFDDTEAEGHAVVLSAAGAAELGDALGSLTHHFTLTRRGRDDGAPMAPVVSARSVPLDASQDLRSV
jgi:hypothetical protein